MWEGKLGPGHSGMGVAGIDLQVSDIMCKALNTMQLQTADIVWSEL